MHTVHAELIWARRWAAAANNLFDSGDALPGSGQGAPQSPIGTFDEMLKLSHFEAFNAVMLSGSMTAAANMLNTAQPNISRSISRLEKESGLKLFDRMPGKLLATADAHALFEEVQRSFIGLRRLTEAASRIQRSGSGILRLGAVQSHSLTIVPRAVRVFNETFPKATLSIHSAHSNVLAQWVREHSCDCAIVSHRDANDGVDGEPLYTAEGVCIMPRSHRLTAKATIVPQDLLGERFITFPRGEPLRLPMDRILHEAGVEVFDLIETSYSAITCSLVAQGVGLAVVNPFVAHGYADSGLVARPFVPAPVHNAIVIFPRGKPLGRLVENFIDTLKSLVLEEKDDIKRLFQV